MWYNNKETTTETVQLVDDTLVYRKVTCNKCEGTGRHRTPCRTCGGEKTRQVKSTCPDCHGKRVVTTLSWEPCRCGTGKFEWPKGSGHMVEHDECKATGRKPVNHQKECETCTGTGQVEKTLVCRACSGTGC
jgi:DnaJ-class molecular chaperone